MKLHVMSDLHFEMRNWKQVVQQMIPGGDILVLAGDIIYLRFFRQAQEQLEEICKKYKKVFYLPGNHEFYKSRVSEAMGVLAAIQASILNMVVLTPGLIINYEGRRFLGGTMWFRDHPMNQLYENLLNDFDLIKDFQPWVYQENTKFLDFMKKDLQQGDIVITHHLPTPLSTPQRFRGDATDRFFLCDVSDLIGERKPALWIHGHTHDPADYMAGETRVYCNPLGYPSEKSNPKWKERIEIEV